MAGRYLITETPPVIIKFLSGDTVTVSVYDMAGNLIVLPPGDEVCTEIAATGVFLWDTSLLPAGTISTTGRTTLLFVMNNTVYSESDIKEWGGWMDRLMGICHEGMHMDQQIYHPTNGGLTSARVRSYKEGAVLGGLVDVIATYQITAVPTGVGQFSSFMMEKV